MSEYEFVSGDLTKLKQPITYLAAPFFNPPQLQLVKQIEAAHEAAGRYLFSPRLQHGPEPVPITTHEQARKVFDENARAIEACTYLLAVTDWLMPEDKGLYVCSPEEFDNGCTKALTPDHAKPLNLPDTGTVWEMGYANRNNITTFIFTTRLRGGKMNIMLTQSAQGVIYGLDHLKLVLGGIQTPEEWEGGHQ